ncbi:MAG: efflux RND transporter periplasmic adaptor subunit [Ignavibacteriales bacterium]|nr:efflux RND transporter periplasmic adaptor subunit [Ignavibacteriales bacterium]
MKIKLKTILIFSLVIIAAIAVYSFIPKNGEKGEEDKSIINYDKLDEVIFEVKTAEVLRGDLDKKISANGFVKAYKELEITSNISGYVERITIYEGKRVKKNDLLVALDDKELRIALKKAETGLEEAKIQNVLLRKETIGNNDVDTKVDIGKEFKELETKYKNGLLTNDEYVKLKEEIETNHILAGGERENYIKIKSGLTAAENNYEQANLNLFYTNIYAPFEGLVSDFDLVEGKRINSGEKLFKLLETNKLKIDVGVLENEISLIEIGNTVEIKLNAIANETFYGKIIFINPAIDTETKTCRLTVEIKNTGNKIKPGMFANVNLHSQKLKNRVLIPKTALLVRDKRNLVFVQEGNLAKWHYVGIGEQNDKYIEIKEGVKPGDRVIIEGHFTLAHDAKIKVLE